MRFNDNFHTSLGPQGLSVKKGFVFISDLVGPEECWVIGSMVGTSVFHVFTVYSGVWPCFSHTKLPSMWCPIFCRLVLVLKLQEGRQEILLVLNLRKAVLDLHGIPTPSRIISWTRSRITISRIISRTISRTISRITCCIQDYSLDCC